MLFVEEGGGVTYIVMGHGRWINSDELTPDIEARIVGSKLLKELFVYTEQTTGHGWAVSWGLQWRKY